METGDSEALNPLSLRSLLPVPFTLWIQTQLRDSAPELRTWFAQYVQRQLRLRSARLSEMFWRSLFLLRFGIPWILALTFPIASRFWTVLTYIILNGFDSSQFSTQKKKAVDVAALESLAVEAAKQCGCRGGTRSNACISFFSDAVTCTPVTFTPALQVFELHTSSACSDLHASHSA